MQIHSKPQTFVVAPPQLVAYVNCIRGTGPTGRGKKSYPLGKILYLWNCSRYIYQICRVYR